FLVVIEFRDRHVGRVADYEIEFFDTSCEEIGLSDVNLRYPGVALLQVLYMPRVRFDSDDLGYVCSSARAPSKDAIYESPLTAPRIKQPAIGGDDGSLE